MPRPSGGVRAKWCDEMKAESFKQGESRQRFELPLRIFTRLIFVGAIATGASSLLSDRAAVSTLGAGRASTGLAASHSDDRMTEPKMANLNAPGAVRPPDPSIMLATTQASVRGDQPVPLGVSVRDVGDAASLMIRGLAPGSKVTGGELLSDGAWSMAIGDLNNAVVVPPSGFAGTMDLTLELAQGDRGVADRKDMRVEWSAKPPILASTSAVPAPLPIPAPITTVSPPPVAAPVTAAAPHSLPPPHIDASEVIQMLERGQDLLKDGKIAAARALFEYVAETGEARAAFLLGGTYDPAVLEKIGAKGVSPDLAMAQKWYEKAKKLGSDEAGTRLEKLASEAK